MGDDNANNNGIAYREVRPVKLDFSATNFKHSVTRWRLAIEKKLDILFPAVCVCACSIIGVVAAAAMVDSPEYQDLQILSRANLPSEDEGTPANPEQVGVDDHRENDGDDNGIGRGDSDDESESVMDANEDDDHHVNRDEDYVRVEGSTLTDFNSSESSSESDTDASLAAA